jgi:glycerophosphoryl diester phosphodiesterase
VRTLSQFNDRMTSKTIDGVIYKNQYFVEDFSLAELKTLGAMQIRAGRPTSYDGQFKVPTLDEVIALAKAKSIETGRTIGIYPELKHATYRQGVSVAQGRSKSYFEDTLVSTLHAAYGNSGNARVFIQGFEVSNLQYLNTTTDIKLVQLVDTDDVNSDGSLSFVATYADGVGPWKPYLPATVSIATATALSTERTAGLAAPPA